MCILWLLDRVFCRYQLSKLDVICLKVCIFLLIFCLDDLSFDISGVLKSATVIVLLSTSPSLAVSSCFIYSGTLILGVFIVGEGKGYPLWYSGLENFMDCIVSRVTKS